MPCLQHSYLPIKPVLCLPFPNIWPFFTIATYAYIPGVSSSMGDTVLSLRAFDCCSSSCRVGTLWSFLRLNWHVSWFCHFPGLVQATVLLKFMYVFPMSCLGDMFSTGILAFASYNLPTPFHDDPWAFSVGIALSMHALVWGTPELLSFCIVSRGGFL